MSVFGIIRRQAFALAIITCAASAYLWPGLYIKWFGVKLMPFVGPSIQLIMFGMGTTLTAADFLRVAKAPWGVAVGAVLQFTVMPLAALGVAKVLGFEGELAAGMVLI
jgi:BASS family bile acid:Na+ symporter